MNLNNNSAIDGQFEVVPPESGMARVINVVLVTGIGVIATI